MWTLQEKPKRFSLYMEFFLLTFSSLMPGGVLSLFHGQVYPSSVLVDNHIDMVSWWKYWSVLSYWVTQETSWNISLMSRGVKSSSNRKVNYSSALFGNQLEMGHRYKYFCLSLRWAGVRKSIWSWNFFPF